MVKLIGFLFPLFVLFNQSPYNLVARIDYKADGYTTDNLGNVYLWKADELKKYNKDGALVNTYSNKSLGKITSVDATNFLKLVVFHRDFSKISFLDNMLAPTGEPIDLQRAGLDQATLAASSHNNGLWLYQQFDSQLIRMDLTLKKTHQSPNLVQLLGNPINPNFLIEKNNLVFLNNPESGILIFDAYGTYKKTVPVKGLNSFQVVEDKIYYFVNNEIKSYDLNTLQEAKINIPEVSSRNVRIWKDRLYVLEVNNLAIYSFI